MFALGQTDDADLITIASADGQLRGTFAPTAGMVCCSLRHRDEELLAQREGLRAYAERGKTMGIPLLHPWANRLAERDYRAGDRAVRLPRDSPLLGFDGNGLPIHGVIPSHLPWELIEPRGEPNAVAASLRWERPELLALFPFPHRLEYEARIEGAALTIATTLHAIADVSVPVSFGYHPYLTIPGTVRAGWRVQLPVSERVLLDDRAIPTGLTEPVSLRPFELKEGGWDDAFTGLLEPTRFLVASAEKSVSLEFLEGYSYAQVYSPPDADFICFEPMTAPTNALRSGTGLSLVAPGGSFRAAFRILASSAASG